MRPASALIQGKPNVAAAAAIPAPVGTEQTGETFSGTTATAALTGVTAGHVILGGIALNPITVTGISVANNSVACTLGTVTATTNYSVQPFKCANASAGANNVVVTASSCAGQCTIIAGEWANLNATLTTFDGSNAATTAGTGVSTSGTFSVTSGDLVYGLMLNQNGGTAPTTGSGFTALSSNPAGTFFYTEYQIAASSGTTATSWTVNANVSGATQITGASTH